MTLQIDDIWPTFACLAALLVFAASPALALADTPPKSSGHRVSSLDGLRGFLALGVFFHHGVVFHDFIADGVWHLPTVTFYRSLGPAGVGMFFMVTGYLFWSKMIADRGRPRWVEFYIGRVFRIGPLYLFAVAAMLGILFSRTGLVLQVPLPRLSLQLLQWALLGYFGSDIDVNGYAGTRLILAGVTWTLRLEWVFYLSLFLMSPAARTATLHAVLPGVVLAIALWSLYGDSSAEGGLLMRACAALFAIGMVSASIQALNAARRIPNLLASALVIVLIAAALVSPSGAYAFPAIVLMGLAFLLIILGCDVFGLLSTIAARRLGNVSYGIYLLQGLVLTLLFSIAPLRRFALASPIWYWAFVLLSAVVLVVVAAMTHVAIERPGIKLGQRICAALPGRTGPGTTPAQSPQKA